MGGLRSRWCAACTATVLCLSGAGCAAGILIGDAKSQPESLTVAPGGVLIVGSASRPLIYKVRPGSTVAEKFIDASSEAAGTFFYGTLANASTGTLWACQLTPLPGTTPVKRETELRSFDLSTGAAKMRWKLPGETSTCNDLAIGPDRALYFTDTANGRIYKLPLGSSSPEVMLENRVLHGVDGITFLNGMLYVNNVMTNHLYRIPVDPAGKAGQPVDIQMDQPLKGPDGMRAANGRLLVAENGSGKIDVIAVDGDKASVRTIKDGLKTPTAVEPAGDMIWIAERGAGRAVSIPMPK